VYWAGHATIALGRESFLRELNEEGIITVKWIPTEEDNADIFMKNLNGPAFEKHASTYIGIDEYMNQNE
jgi:hypothetical protein